MVELESVSKRYGSTQALDNLSLSLESGEVFGYIGPNGAGKTTTIKILTGLIRDYEGSVSVEGTPIEGHRGEIHRLIGYLPQEASFHEWRTVEEVLFTFGRLSGLGDARLRARTAEVLELLGLAEHRNRRVLHLSGGTVQRLRLAQAIIHEPRILILDEPLSGLDPASRAQVGSIVRELAGGDRLVLFSSHILSDVESVATSIGILHDGKLRDLGTPAELRERHGIGTVVEIVARPGAGLAASGAGWDAAVERAEQIDSDTIRLHLAPGTDLDAAIGRLLATLAGRGVPVRRLEHVRPSLEDVYLSLTGGSR